MTPLIAISLIVSFSIITIAACVWLGYKAASDDSKWVISGLEREVRCLEEALHVARSETEGYMDECLQYRLHVAKAHAQLRDRVKPKLP